MSIQEVMDKINSSDDLGVIITEHMDLNFPPPNQFLFDQEAYFNEYMKYRSSRLLLGIELGMTPENCQENKKIIEAHPFDCVVGSIHVVDNMDLFMKESYQGRAKQAVYERYFDSMINCLKLHGFIDTLGHIDYISRYAVYKEKEIAYPKYRELIDEVLGVLIREGIVLEINTRRLHLKGVFENYTEICRRFYELGGRMVTIGSDAHDPESIGKDFPSAVRIAELCNLRIVYFKERRPEYI
jgi:histidinol-phosphatase (PHP family)